ncbi:hypothetical protein [Halorubrum sp. Hd13]|uniref:hypothetical protein n=1 Tax=Halorubrum sp. Hd13 TaxID=1480728 RepID=UPI000B992F12|nr:hypothetical protein [Halorubrum sp. Hd13]OYR45254.1 hypothetical protein DJ81_05260 [Halorubrum sp. Hd13]
MSPVEVEIRRNRYGSVLAYSDRDRASRLLADHRAVLQSLYDLVDRRHGTDGDVVARLHVRDEERRVKGLDLADRFRRNLEADRAIALVEDVRYHAGERELVTDGGRPNQDLERIADALELQNALLLQLIQDRERERVQEDPDHSGRSDHAIATDVVDSYGDLYGGSIGSWPFDPVTDRVGDMGDSR